ncbi:HigA family addiction module antitoxin [Caulobacter sp. CCNWLY153]|uniref:HigA family addiction module antitoxin n=1 Tax=unclassified Caulobacter TaxID=2648921 RepID=UPI002FF0DD7A
MPPKTQPQPPTPADVLREKLVDELGVTQDQLADALGVSRYSVNQLINDKRTVTAEMALRLSAVLGTSPEFWLQLQMAVDLDRARRKLSGDLSALTPLKRDLRPHVSLAELVGS